MSRKAGFRIAGCKPIAWVFAFVLSVTQVYPAIAACLCLPEIQETVEVSISSGDALSCCSAATSPATQVERNSGNGRCSKAADEGGSSTRISPDECCGIYSAWIPPLPASLSRTVEFRAGFDAMPLSRTEETWALVPRIEGLTRDFEPGVYTGSSATLYLINASLLI